MLLSLWLACADPAPPPADRAAVERALAFPGQAPPLEPRWGPSTPIEGGRVQVLSYAVRPGFEAAAALWTPDDPLPTGIIVAHGHFGQGKSSPEAQAIAHRLAARGHRVLAVDTPGVEEWEQPGRQIHFEGGASNRARLVAAGSSALALQVEILRRGIDLLEEQGARHIAATGASGGAVQSFYLLLADPRVRTAVMASFPPLPREARAGGCACDLLPGWPGPQPGLLALLDRPTLWLSEVEQPRPLGLPCSARVEVLPGPHGYEAPMQEAAIEWIEGELGEGRERDLSPPLLDLRSLPSPDRALPLRDLLPLPGGRWEPQPWGLTPVELTCAGQGPTLLAAGALPEDLLALRAAGWRACELRLPEDEAGASEAQATGRVYADRAVEALRTAARQSGARALWARRAWGLPAAWQELPYVLVDPLEDPALIDSIADPDWVWVPGLASGQLVDLASRARARGPDRAALIAALEALRTGPPAPRPTQ